MTTVPLKSLTDTWNNGATTFVGLQYNITNTASAAGSLLVGLQIGGLPIHSFDKDGSWYFYNGTNYSRIYPDQGQNIAFSSAGAGFAVFNRFGTLSGSSGTELQFGSTGTLSWGPNAAPFGVTADVGITRDTTGILAQRSGTNANTFRVYNTFTDASNYERGVFDWTTTANVLRIGTQAAGTGTLRNVFLDAGSQLSVLNSGSESIRVTGTTFFTLQSASGLISIGSGADAGISRAAAASLAFGNGSASDASATFKTKTKAGVVVAGDLPSGDWQVIRDTTNNTTKVYYNNAGTLMVAALT